MRYNGSIGYFTVDTLGRLILMKRNAADLQNVVRLAFQLGAEEIMVTNVLPYSEEMKGEILYTRSMSMYQPRARRINLPRVDVSSINVENFPKSMEIVFRCLTIPVRLLNGEA